MINPYWELIILLCLINIIFAVSLNLILGYNGQFSLGHAGFLAIGAYTSGALTSSFGWPLWAGILCAIAFSIVAAVLIGYPCLRLRGDYLAIATLGFAEIIRIVALALPTETFGGPTGMQDVYNLTKYVSVPDSSNGIGNFLFTVVFSVAFIALAVWGIWALVNMLQRFIDRYAVWPYWRWSMLGIFIACLILFHKALWKAFVEIFQYEQSFRRTAFESTQWVLFVIFLVVVGAVTLLVRNYLNSVPGRAVIAIREDEIAATNLGVNCTWLKLQNFMFGCGLAGLAGALYAHTYPIFKPADFNFFKSVDVLLMVVLGGMGSITGSFIGATIITFLLEALRFLGRWRLVFYSLILILFMIFRPGGLMGTSELGQLLKRRATDGLNRLLGDRDGKSGEEGGDARS